MLPEEPPVPPLPTVTHPDVRIIYTVPVSRGNLMLEANPFAHYMVARTERQLFLVDGVPVLGIFVSVGDEVSEGDIIAALYKPEIQQELNELNRARNAAAFELQLLQERHDLALYLASRFGSFVDSAPFVASQTVLEAEIEVLDRLIDYVTVLDEARYLRATMDGIVTDAMTFVAGMYSSSSVNIAVISDRAFTSFVVQGGIAEEMTPGDRFIMTLGPDLHYRRAQWGAAPGTELDDTAFLVEVIDPVDFGFVLDILPDDDGPASAFLAFVDAPPAEGFDTVARVHIPLAEATDVLFIPASTLHRHDDRSFVYVLSNGVRAVRDVVSGLESGGYVEIVSGLAEGDLIVR